MQYLTILDRVITAIDCITITVFEMATRLFVKQFVQWYYEEIINDP